MADIVRLDTYLKRLPSPAEGLRLIKAFSKISDAKRRAKIIAMAEEAAAQSRHDTKPPKKS
jgi:hypothetical protein